MSRFSEHEVKFMNENLIQFKHPKTWRSHCFISLMGSSLVIAGDIDIASFQYFNGSGTVAHAIEWMGSRESVCEYFCEKLSIGMSDHDSPYDFCMNNAIDDAVEYAKNEFEGHEKEWRDEDLESLLSDLQGIDCKYKLIETFEDFLDRELGPSYFESIHKIGQIYSERAIVAHDALRACYLKLNE